MEDYRFRATTPDGRTVFEATSPAKNVSEAIAVGLRTAGEVKSREPLDSCCDRWFIDILDPSGCWLMSLPLAMVSRSPGRNVSGAALRRPPADDGRRAGA